MSTALKQKESETTNNLEVNTKLKAQTNFTEYKY